MTSPDDASHHSFPFDGYEPADGPPPPGARHAPATLRNREPIAAQLARWVADGALPERAAALEIASGTGEHGLFFVQAFAGWTWQPTDFEPASVASVQGWRGSRPDLHDRWLAPVRLDATAEPWPVPEGAFDLVFNANLIHIAPWAVTLGLVAGAARSLRPGGSLVLYGPFKRGGEHTAPSNADFEAWLRSKDPSYGVRDLEAVVEVAAAAGLRLVADVAMPANNALLRFERKR